jgi:hypothetical protein
MSATIRDIAEALDQAVTVQNAAAWFRHCGYQVLRNRARSRWAACR